MARVTTCIVAALAAHAAFAIEASLSRSAFLARGGSGAFAANGSSVSREATSDPSSTESQHQTLDFGFNTFEIKAEDAVLTALDQKLPKTVQPQERHAFQEAVRSQLKETFDLAVKPTKMRISKHWLELKEEKRDAFVTQLKERFAGIFDGKADQLANRTLVAFYTPETLPPKAAIASVRAKVRDVVERAGHFLTHQLDDYVEMYYMSSIFLAMRRSHPQRPSTLLALQTASRMV
eukprot:TRINITY_DN56703_c0_g1_i1.p1 TRINITY_DN56703_c0_g1~~TRINITY_DN56703_c0_g1_i1.p1  ORF type:complete len:235 (+),score=59.01 TRINITY_DN56703_c0_g1_i1:52-756(+)